MDVRGKRVDEVLKLLLLLLYNNKYLANKIKIEKLVNICIIY